MDEATRKSLIDATEVFHEQNDWASTEALWQPYADQGDLEAEFRLAYYYLTHSFDEEPEKKEEMRARLKAAAEKDHADAAYWWSHQLEEGAARDAMLLRAGELGSRSAQRDLGALYATGDWTGPKDPALGLAWYRKAAERGHSDAQYNLGFMYLLGEGTPADPEEGLRWLDASANQGSRSAMRLLADLHSNGYYGVSLDPALAAHWAARYETTLEPPWQPE